MGILAAYLLGFDTTNTENQAKIKAEFAEVDDKRVDKAGPFNLRFDVPPEVAIDYFKRKKVVTKTEFNKLENEAKAAAFTVGGIYKQDLLESFKTEISDALESGQSQNYVIKQFKDILDGAGHKELGNWHLENVVRRNLRISYSVGGKKATRKIARNSLSNLDKILVDLARKHQKRLLDFYWQKLFTKNPKIQE